jgi:hypothetical protein
MATLATGLLARFGRAGLAPAGFHQGVFTVSYSVPPLPRFSQRVNDAGRVKSMNQLPAVAMNVAALERSNPFLQLPGLRCDHGWIVEGVGEC